MRLKSPRPKPLNYAMNQVRPPAVAGSFYPARTAQLRALLEQCFLTHPLGPQGALLPSPSLLGGVVPHAGYVYSGPCAAHFYSLVERDIRHVILLGVNHRGKGAKAALSPDSYWETPLGRVAVDRELAASLKEALDFVREDGIPHRGEHSIEVQLPFLQQVLDSFSFVPISLSHLSLDECRIMGRAVASLCLADGSPGKKTVLIASSDLNHYLSPRETERLDGLALARLLDLDPEGLLETVSREGISMCGVVPVAVMLFAVREMGAPSARLLKHCHSGDAAPMSEVVGYASVAVDAGK